MIQEGAMVNEALHGMGIQGAIISVLMGTITLLAGVIVIQYKHNNKVYGYRLRERDTLNKALTDSTNAQLALMKAVEEYGDITSSLSGVVERQSVAFNSLSERVKTQYDVIKDENSRILIVIDAISASLRVISGQMTDLQRLFPNSVGEVKNFVSEHSQKVITEVSKVVGNGLNTIARRRTK